jgi:hypothetical protein
MEKRVLDEQTKAMLRGVAPFAYTSTIEFTPDFFSTLQIEKQFVPVFIIRGLTVEEGRELDTMIRNASQATNFNADAFGFVRKLVTGWRNVFDAGSGEELAFISENGGCPASLFEMLPQNVKNSIFTCVTKMRGLVDGAKVGL